MVEKKFLPQITQIFRMGSYVEFLLINQALPNDALPSIHHPPAGARSFVAHSVSSMLFSIYVSPSSTTELVRYDYTYMMKGKV